MCGDELIPSRGNDEEQKGAAKIEYDKVVKSEKKSDGGAARKKTHEKSSGELVWALGLRLDLRLDLSPEPSLGSTSASKRMFRVPSAPHLLLRALLGC